MSLLLLQRSIVYGSLKVSLNLYRSTACAMPTVIETISNGNTVHNNSIYKILLLSLSGTSLPAPSWLRPTINVPNSIVPCYVAMDNFSQHKKDDDTWYSTPFYSGPQGYKMRLKIYANGHGSGGGTNVSVYVQIIQGEYDDTLTWPYTGTVTFEIINWKEDSNHVKMPVDFSEKVAVASGCGKQPKGENSNTGWGHPQVLSHNELYGSNSQYINNDILYIRVSSITL